MDHPLALRETMMRSTRNTCAFSVGLAALLQSVSAFAGISDGALPIRVSEPETLALLAIGAVAVLVARWSKRK